MKKIVGGAALFLLPAFVLAQTLPATNTTLNSILVVIGSIVKLLLPIVIGLGVIVFLWGVVQYMTSGADEEKKGEARNLMIYGIIGRFVMVSIGGLVAVLARTFNVGQGGSPLVPGVPTQGQSFAGAGCNVDYR